MGRNLDEYLISCTCGDLDWDYFAGDNGPTLETAIAIGPARVVSGLHATWDASAFPEPPAPCRRCKTVYAHANLSQRVTPHEHARIIDTYPCGYWYGYVAPDPVYAGGVMLSARVRAGSTAPLFSWRFKHEAGGTILKRARPDAAEHAALVDLLTMYGPAALTVLTGLAPHPAVSLTGAIATTIDALR